MTRGPGRPADSGGSFPHLCVTLRVTVRFKASGAYAYLMGAATRAVLLTLALLTIFLSSIPGALATEEQVQTPDGTYYVSEDRSVTAPSVDTKGGPQICVLGNTCFILPGVDGGQADVTISLWEETNGCEGLQEEATTCPDTDEEVPADEKVAGV